MRLLYVALDQTVPGTVGGSVHVQGVAEGLAALGHDVHVATTPGGRWPRGAVTWHSMSPPFGVPALRWTRAAAVARLARRIDAAVVMERYYNFGGEGVMAARRLGRPAVLEVNAPVIDYPGSPKAAVDRALIAEPMRRWRERVCRHVDLFVAPSASMLPAWVDPARVLEIEWGADTSRFRPGAAATPPFARAGSHIWCVFSGAFRRWHGAPHLAAALAALHQAGDDRFGAVFVGDGPERQATEQAASGVPRVIFTGRVSHDRLPAFLASADIGVAPFDPARHPPMRLGFFWSPLKVFEYMASGLPVVAPAIPRLGRLVEHGREGWLYDPQDPRGLQAALTVLSDDSLRQRLGAAARARAVREYGWDVHCAKLDARLRRLTAGV